jgi:hypothetical protein
MTRLAVLAAVVLLAGSACGGGKSAIHGGNGLVTAAGRVGSLRIDVATRRAIVAFAGTPDVTVSGVSSWPGMPRYHALAYGCVRTNKESLDRLVRHWSCRTVYYINVQTARLAAFYTESPDFRTPKGVRPGMAQNVADRLEHQTPHGPWFAIGEGTSTSPDLIIPSSCGAVVSGRCVGRVLAFMLESRRHPIGLTFT